MHQQKKGILLQHETLAKHLGSQSDYIYQRDQHLLNLCKEYDRICFREGRDIDVLARMTYAVSQPAPRYWVSEYRATIIVSEFERGKHTDNHLTLREKMYKDIYARYLELRKHRPDDSIFSIVFDIVNSQAPESYIDPKSAKIIVFRHISRLKSGMESATNKVRRLCEKIQKIKNERIHKNDEEYFSDRVNNDDIDILASAASGSIADGIIDSVADGRPLADEDVVRDASCQPDAPDDKHVLSAQPLFPCRRKGVAIHSLSAHCLDYSIRARRKHTNIRYVSSQLCIDWFDNHE